MCKWCVLPRCIRHRWFALALALLAGAVAGPAQARGLSAGALQEVFGHGSCLSVSRVGCLKGPFRGALDVAVAPDGRHVYVLSRADRPLEDPYGGPYVVLAFARDASGRLAALSGRGGCLSRDPATANGDRPAPSGCWALPRSSQVDFSFERLAVSPDGRHVYVAGLSKLLALERDPTTGALIPLPGQAGCLAERQDPPDLTCTPLRGLGIPGPIAFSPDGRSLYVVSQRGAGDGVTTLTRDPRSGVLAHLCGPRSHFSRRTI